VKKFVGNVWFPQKLGRHIMLKILVMARTNNVVEAQTKNSHGNHNKSRSNTRKRLVECDYCHKMGHIKKDCYALKKKEKEKGLTVDWFVIFDKDRGNKYCIR
jgi:hypothetical protein